MTKKAKKYVWSTIVAKVGDVQPTEKNYKIKSDLGRERLQHSIKSFGMAGVVVCNWVGKVGDKTKLMLIDGNSRLQEAKEAGDKTIQVSVPDRKLTPQEFKEMSAMIDFAKAGEVDMERIQQDLGGKEDFYKAWGMQVPMEMLAKMGKNANVEKLEYPEEGKGAAPEVSDIRMVQLFFSDKQEVEFRKIEEKLKKKWKLNNTTDTVFKAFKLLGK